MKDGDLVRDAEVNPAAVPPRCVIGPADFHALIIRLAAQVVTRQLDPRENPRAFARAQRLSRRSLVRPRSTLATLTCFWSMALVASSLLVLRNDWNV
jgi:hypothetical protein